MRSVRQDFSDEPLDGVNGGERICAPLLQCLELGCATASCVLRFKDAAESLHLVDIGFQWRLRNTAHGCNGLLAW